MAGGRRSRPVLPWLAAGAGAIAIGVVTILSVAGDDSPGAGDVPGPTTTSLIETLGTVAPDPLPDLCSTDPDSLAIWTAAVRADEELGTADAVVRFENLTSETCELDLTDPSAREDGVERSARLLPGGWADLVIGSRESECDQLLPLHSIVLELNDDEVTVLTAAVVACEPALLAYLPADPPVDRCLAADLTSAVAPTGLVLRNDGTGPCVLGELASVELPTGPAPSLTEMAQTRPGSAIEGPVGAELTELGPGDVVYFQTIRDPIADCTSSVQPARLHFAELRVDVDFPICTFVRLGPGRPYFGAPRGPLADAGSVAGSSADVEAWIAALDPFGE
jgi:hypothetical protein